jgi:hypothetical protein
VSETVSRLHDIVVEMSEDHHLPGRDPRCTFAACRELPGKCEAVSQWVRRAAAWIAVPATRVSLIGHTDTDKTTCLYMPSIATGSPPSIRSALIPRAVVVGHGPLEPDNAPRHIQETRRYIQDFIRLDDETRTALELYDRMLALYPDRINPGSLWGAANAAKAHRHAEA